jgi:hypothetical protein
MDELARLCGQGMRVFEMKRVEWGDPNDEYLARRVRLIDLARRGIAPRAMVTLVDGDGNIISSGVMGPRVEKDGDRAVLLRIGPVSIGRPCTLRVALEDEAGHPVSSFEARIGEAGEFEVCWRTEYTYKWVRVERPHGWEG